MRHSVLNTLLLGAMLFGTAATCYAVKARPGALSVMQPDGTTLTVTITGDERNHYYTTDDGYLLCDEGGYFTYATFDDKGSIVSTGVRARDISARTAADKAMLAELDAPALIDVRRSEPVTVRPSMAQGPGLFPGTAFPSTGHQKGLVVLVEYTDVKFSVSNPHDFFYNLLNKPGFNQYGATGSARDWYMESSNGQFQPDFDVYGPITLANKQSYYGGNDYSGDDKNPWMMAIEACQQLDATVDFSQYDRDGDGYIDNVYVFYAGKGEADGGGANTVWPHSYDVSAAVSTVYRFDGVRLDRYACSNEWDNYNNRPDGIGTFCHEFGHVMGLPDLYSTSYTSAFTPGDWDVMDGGSYTNNGRTPPTMSAFERYALGWIEPVVIDGPLNGRMEHILTSNRAYLIPTSKSNEYFLLENRQLRGSDFYIPHHGMLIWHIDYNSSKWTNNVVNNTASHQYVDLEEADGTQTEGSRSGDAFPGSANKTSFTDDTSPSMKTWAGAKLNMPITDIKEANGIITFKVKGGTTELAAPTINMIDEVTTDGFTISWDPVVGITNYAITLRTNIDVTRVIMADYDHKDVAKALSYTFTGLTKGRTYYFTVEAVNGKTFSAPSESVAVTIPEVEYEFEDRRVELLALTDLAEESVTLNWRPVKDATDYIVNIFTRSYSDMLTASNDFAAGVLLPDGWTTTATSTYTTSLYSGKASPSLKLASDGAYIQTPVYDTDYIHTLEFWHRGATSSSSNAITVQALVSGTWVDVKTVDIVNNSGGRTTSVDMPPFTTSARIVFSKPSSGYLAIDDVKVTYGGSATETMVAAYTDRTVGNVTSHTATGLDHGTTYYYTIHATNGTAVSKKSPVAYFVTKGTSGAEVIEAGATLKHLEVGTDGQWLYVSAPIATEVTVADALGRIIGSAPAAAYGNRFRLPGTGLYIVRAGTQSKKVFVR